MRFGRQMKRMLKKPREAKELAKGSMFLVTVVLCLGLIIMSRGIEDYFVSDLKANAQNLARGYTHSLRKTVEASSAVRALINEKLRYGVDLVSTLSGDFSNEDLRKIAREIDVDEIDVYSPKGEILYSSISSYLGWIAPKGHPVQQFISSSLSFHVDPLRENTISSQLVLYGYQRLEDGRVIQVGISAKHLEGLLTGFELDRMLNEMKDDEDVSYVTYIDQNRIVLGSSTGRASGSYLPKKEQKNSLIDSLRGGQIQAAPVDAVYELEEPVLMEGVEAGRLVIGLSLERTIKEIEKLNRIFTVVFVMIYLAAILMLYLYHYKSARLHTMAYEDEVTKLPNLKYFRSELEYLLISKRKEKLAVILVQLPRFSKISMARGHEQGERLLEEMGREFSHLEGENLSFFKHSDEKFLILVKNYESPEELIELLANLATISPSGESEQESRYSTLRFGVVEIKDQSTTPGKVLKDALIALNHAKLHQGLYFSFFDQDMERKVDRETKLEAELRQVLKKKDEESVYLLYQPIIGKHGSEISSVEALARMKSPSLGDVSPLEFIDVAEKNGLIGPLGMRILEKACAFSNKLKQQGISLKISVNLSGLQILEDDFIRQVREVLKENDVSAGSLSLEITESVFLGNYDIINEKLKTLQEMGMTISIDDFGTGYSSFARLKELHVDGVKIDRYFISRITHLPEEELITSDIIRMVRRYGLYTVAEGVETEEELSYLQREGCDFIQGYYYSKPLPEGELIQYWRNFQNEKWEG